MSMATFSSGDVVVALWPHKRTAEGKPRPAIIVQADDFVSDDETILLVPFTSDMALPLLGCRIRVLEGSSDHDAMGITRSSTILPDKLVHLPLAFIDGRVGGCPPRLLRHIEDGIWLVLALQTIQTNPGVSGPSPMIPAPAEPVSPESRRC